jgi:NADH-quinone oxidoreductase subunit B
MTRSTLPNDPCHEVGDERGTPLPAIPLELQPSVKLSTLDRVFAWARKRSFWPMLVDLACCPFELVATASQRPDATRLMVQSLPASPQQADLMIVSGTVTRKMAPLLVRLYTQMAEPKAVIAMGACAISGGPFKEGYSVVSGVDRLIPVDVYVPGCPPHAEALLEGIRALQTRFDDETRRERQPYLTAEDLGMPETILGPVSVNWRDLEGLAGPKRGQG